MTRRNMGNANSPCEKNNTEHRTYSDSRHINHTSYDKHDKEGDNQSAPSDERDVSRFTSLDGGHFTSSDGGHFTSSAGGQFTSSDGGQFTSSDGGYFTSSDGGHFTSSDGGHLTSSGGHFTSSDGGHFTSSDGGHFTSSAGGQFTSSDGGYFTSSDGGHLTSSGGHFTSSDGGQFTSSDGGHFTSSDGGHLTSSGGHFTSSDGGHFTSSDGGNYTTTQVAESSEVRCSATNSGQVAYLDDGQAIAKDGRTTPPEDNRDKSPCSDQGISRDGIQNTSAVAEQCNSKDVERNPPLDGGYGWVIVLSSFVAIFLVDGILFSFGILLVILIEEFNESTVSVAALGGLLMGCLSLSAPLSGPLIDVFGKRYVTVFGSALFSLALFVSMFANSLGLLYLLYGILGGFGFGLMVTPPMAAVMEQFSAQKRALAQGLALCGSETCVIWGMLIAYVKNIILNRELIQIADTSIILVMINMIKKGIIKVLLQMNEMSDGLLLQMAAILLLQMMDIVQPHILYIVEESIEVRCSATVAHLDDGQYIAKDGRHSPPEYNRDKSPGSDQGISRDGIQNTSTAAKKCNSNDVERNPPLDGGYGWVIVVSSFVAMFLVDGILFSFGILLVVLMEELNESTASVAALGGILMGCLALSAPLSGPLIDVFGKRYVTVFGSALFSLALFVSMFANSLGLLYLLYGILGGFGFGFLLTPTIAAVMEQFSAQKRALAQGLGLCGSGVGTFVMNPVTNLLLETYGRRGTFLILSGIMLHGIPCGLAIPQTRTKRKSHTSQRETDIQSAQPTNTPHPMQHVEDKCFKRLWKNNLSFLCDFRCVCIMLATFCFGLAGFIPLTYLPKQAIDLGIEKYETAWLISSAGISNTLGRIGTGWLGSRPFTNRKGISAFILLFDAASFPISLVLTSFSTKLVYALIYGAMYGANVVLLPVLLADSVSLDNVDKTPGLFLAMLCGGGVIGVPFAGWTVDITGDFNVCYILAGAETLLAAIFLMLPTCRDYLSRTVFVNKTTHL